MIRALRTNGWISTCTPLGLAAALVAALSLAGVGCSKRTRHAAEPDQSAQPGVAAHAADVRAAQPDAAPAGGDAASQPTPSARKAPPADYPYIAPADATPDLDLRALIDTMREPHRGADTLDGFKAKGKAGHAALVNALRAPVANIRFQSAMFLGAWNEHKPATGEALCLALAKDPEDDVRAAAARALMLLASPATVDCLVAALASDPYETARANAAWALGKIGSTRATDTLIAALKDDKTWVRLRSVTALMHLKATKAVPDLVDLLSDSNKMVRDRALDALREITGKRLGADPGAWQSLVRRSR